MARVLIHLVRRAGLDYPAKIHDGDAVADVFYDGKVVRDEQVAEAEFLLEVEEEVDDLALDGDIKGGDRFVADDEFWLEGDGAGDADTLTLASGEFEREFVGGTGRETDFFQ